MVSTISLSFATDSKKTLTISKRPIIEDVLSIKHDDLPLNWKLLKESIIEFNTMIMELYPDFDIFFIGPHSEIFSDALKLMYPQKFKNSQIGTIKITKNLLGDPNLKQYLKEQGLDIGKIDLGRKALLIDIGSDIELLKGVQKAAAPTAPEKIWLQTFFKTDFNNPGVNAAQAVAGKEMAFKRYLPSDIFSNYLKTLPLYEKEITHLVKYENKIHPIVTANDKESIKTVERMLEDLKFSITSDSSFLEIINERKGAWGYLYGWFKHGDMERLRSFLHTSYSNFLKGKNDPHYQEVLHDFINYCNRRMPMANFDPLEFGILNQQLPVSKYLEVPKYEKIIKNVLQMIEEKKHGDIVILLSRASKNDEELVSIITQLIASQYNDSFQEALSKIISSLNDEKTFRYLLQNLFLNTSVSLSGEFTELFVDRLLSLSHHTLIKSLIMQTPYINLNYSENLLLKFLDYSIASKNKYLARALALNKYQKISFLKDSLFLKYLLAASYSFKDEIIALNILDGVFQNPTAFENLDDFVKFIKKASEMKFDEFFKNAKNSWPKTRVEGEWSIIKESLNISSHSKRIAFLNDKIPRLNNSKNGGCIQTLMRILGF